MRKGQGCSLCEPYGCNVEAIVENYGIKLSMHSF